MKTFTVWEVADPMIGPSYWTQEADACQVAAHRTVTCVVSPVDTFPGMLVSTLGAPDYRIPERMLYDFAAREGRIDAPDRTNTCRSCGEAFPVTQAMIDEHRDASDYGDDDDLSDDEIANVIEFCAACAGIEEATDNVTKF